MATQLRIKRRTADANAPAGLTAGEMAINLFDKKLYVGGTAGTNVIFLDSTSSVGLGTANTFTQLNTFSAGISASGATFSATTASTSSTTGAVIVAGGVGIAKDSFINSQRIGVGLLQDTTNLGVGVNALAATTAGGNHNTAIGSGCGQAITSGAENTLLGYAVGSLINTGGYNCSIGTASLNQNQSGNFNTAMGYGALEKTTASNNTAVGIAALGNITTGALNTAVGREAGNFQADGTTALTTANNSVYLGRDTRGTQSDSNSVVIGYQAIGLGANTTVIGTSSTTSATVYGALSVPSTTASTSSTTGAVIVAGGVGIAKDSFINGHRIGQGLLASQTNLAVGANTLASTIAGGIDNVAVGNYAGSNITTGSGNVMLGAFAGQLNTTGQSNMCIGNGAHYSNTTGSYNVAIGTGAGHEQNNASVYNLFLGTNSGYWMTSGSNNVCLGGLAGVYHANGSTNLTASSDSVYIGYNAKGFNNSDSNSVVIGANAIGLGANTTVIGTSSTTETKLFGLLNLPSGLSAAGATFSAPITSTRMARHTSAAISAQKTATFSPTAAEDGTVFYINYNGKGMDVTLDGLPIGWRAKFLNVGSGTVNFVSTTGNIYGEGLGGLRGWLMEAICIDTNTYFIG